MRITKGYTIPLPTDGHKNLKRLALEKETTMLALIFTALDTAYPEWRKPEKKENGLA